MSDPLIRAWIWLVALSGVSTALSIAVARGALSGPMISVGGALILTLAWAKSRIILVQYLGLAEAPFWRRGFEMVLAFYAILLLGLYLAG
ncbi:nitric oxide reductase F protein [Phaeovulum sp.]|uniref:nitric oxide reductase F protein n=1 Tax=Phaeovulum sp. TaxID=2934796 RepID=UPI0039E6B1C5